MKNELIYQNIKPNKSIYDFVESFWMLDNQSEFDKEIVVLPDGRIDLFFSYSNNEPFHCTLIGLETAPTQILFSAKTKTFAISFKLLATEYVLKTSIADLINEAKILPNNFWDFTQNDLNDFDEFCSKSTSKILGLLSKKIDERKLQLFNLIYQTQGSATVKELSEKVFWTSRQINRYFNQQFGMSLKTYCNVLRFRASFQHIKEGKLFPEMNFADQAHFIKEVKKLAGVIPKELSKNKNDRFIQFSTLTTK